MGLAINILIRNRGACTGMLRICRRTVARVLFDIRNRRRLIVRVCGYRYLALTPPFSGARDRARGNITETATRCGLLRIAGRLSSWADALKFLARFAQGTGSRIRVFPQSEEVLITTVGKSRVAG